MSQSTLTSWNFQVLLCSKNIEVTSPIHPASRPWGTLFRPSTEDNPPCRWGFRSPRGEKKNPPANKQINWRSWQSGQGWTKAVLPDPTILRVHMFDHQRSMTSSSQRKDQSTRYVYDLAVQFRIISQGMWCHTHGLLKKPKTSKLKKQRNKQTTLLSFLFCITLPPPSQSRAR